MHTALATLIDRLASSAMSAWTSFTGAHPFRLSETLSRSRVATLGLNPSNREFVDDPGRMNFSDLNDVFTHY